MVQYFLFLFSILFSITASAKAELGCNLHLKGLREQMDFRPSEHSQNFKTIIQEIESLANRRLSPFEERTLILMKFGVPHQVYLVPKSAGKVDANSQKIFELVRASTLSALDAKDVSLARSALGTPRESVSDLNKLLPKLREKRIERAIELSQDPDALNSNDDFSDSQIQALRFASLVDTRAEKFSILSTAFTEAESKVLIRASFDDTPYYDDGGSSPYVDSPSYNPNRDDLIRERDPDDFESDIERGPDSRRRGR